MRPAQPNSVCSRRSRQAGYSLLETGLALGITALAFAALVTTSNQSASVVQDNTAADRLTQVYSAAQQYLQANSTALVAAIPVGSSVAVVVGRTSAAASVPANSLQSGGYLPASFIDANPYGQTTQVVLRQTTAGNIDMLVETVGGRTVPDNDLGRITAKVGAPGGMILAVPPPTVAAGTIQGTGGGWAELATAWTAGGVTPTKGHMVAVAYANQTTLLADFLYRNNIGIPEANKMHTNIDMSHNALNATGGINNIDTASGTNNPLTVGSVLTGNSGGQVQVANGLDACTSGTTGCNLAVSSNGAFYDENDGWVRFRGPNAAGGLALDGTANNLQVGGNTILYGTASVAKQASFYGNVQMRGTPTISWPDVSAATIAMQQGNILAVNGAGITASGNIVAGGSLTAGTTVTAGTSVTSPIYYDAASSTYYMQPSSFSHMNQLETQYLSTSGLSPTSGYTTEQTGMGLHAGDVYVEGLLAAGKNQDGTALTWIDAQGGYAQIGGELQMKMPIILAPVAADGASCGQNGALAANTNGGGATMTCFSGVWMNTGTTAKISEFELPNGFPGQIDYSIGTHFYCALWDTWEHTNDGTDPTYVGPNPTRIFALGTTANGLQNWALERGTQNTQGGGAECIDY